jgi:hypothetical protein
LTERYGIDEKYSRVDRKRQSMPRGITNDREGIEREDTSVEVKERKRRCHYGDGLASNK